MSEITRKVSLTTSEMLLISEVVKMKKKECIAHAKHLDCPLEQAEYLEHAQTLKEVEAKMMDALSHLIDQVRRLAAAPLRLSR